MKSRNSRRQSIASRHSQGRSGTYLRQASPPLRGYSLDDFGIPHTYHDYNDNYATSHHNYDPSEDGISHHNYDPHRRADDEDSSDHDDDDDSDSSSSDSRSNSDHDYAQGDTRHLITNPHTLQLTQPREYTIMQGGHVHHPQLSTLEEENEDDLSSSRGPGTPITLGRSFSSGASLIASAPPPVSLTPLTPTSPVPRTLPRLFDVVEEAQSHTDYSPTTSSTVNNPLIPDFTKKRSRYFIPTALESISEKHDLKLNHHEDDHDHEEAAFGISAIGATTGAVGTTTAGVGGGIGSEGEVKRSEEEDDTPFALLTKSALKNSRLRLAEDDNDTPGTSVGGLRDNTSPHTSAKPYRYIGPEDLPALATNKNKVNFKDSPRPPLANNTTPSLPPLTLSTNNTVPKPKYYAPQPTGNKSAAFQSRFTQARMSHDRHSDAGSRAHSHRHGAGTTGGGGGGHMRQSRMTARSRVSHSSSLYNGAKAL